MYSTVAVAGSNSPHDHNTTPTVNAKRKNTILSRYTEVYESKCWQPPALRAPVLILTIAVCWGLIAVLEFLLSKSQRDGGLIFAPKINDLPLAHTFLYLYFPTIIAVMFSIYWAWIDLETKRMEPYYQLSKENGALGKDSLLLQYPFSFIPLVPIRAFRDRHWPVFWGSLAVVLVTWGLVPTQAGIFTVQTVTRTTNTTFAVSTYSMPFDKQATSLSFRYAQSTYGIVSLNETLPPYMARNYTLAPFQLRNSQGNVTEQGSFTAPTTMYTLDLYCENVSHKADNSTSFDYVSSGGCNVNVGLTGNTTIADGKERNDGSAVKQYNGMYMGYHNPGFADFYLSTLCPKSENTTFFAAFEKTKEREEDPPKDVTAIFCRPRYWRQEVSATVDIRTRAPLKVQALAEKQPLEWDVFNTTNFESIMNGGSIPGVSVRSDVVPTFSLPKYGDLVARTNLTMTNMPMVGLAIGAGTRPLEDYLDWKVLSEAYADAYRLLFVRAMVDVLGGDSNSSTVALGQQNFESSKEVLGEKSVTSEAVSLVPVFVHIVVGFLGVVSLATVALLFLSLIRKRNLRTDPSTIASIMAMVADDELLLSDFADLDCCTMEDVQNIIGQKRYKLCNDERGTSLSEVSHQGVVHLEGAIIDSSVRQRRDSPSSIAKPVRPLEFSLWVAVPFIGLFMFLAIVLGIIYNKAHANGLPLPSPNTIVQNILENYIPTAVATLIEPMWVLINRLLCMLQPLEELRGCNARAEKSIDTDYSSLPPQLVIFQALKSKHFVLAAVCAMALLANLLAVAFSGLFNQISVDIRHATAFQPPYEFKFAPVNGSVGPSTAGLYGYYVSGAWQGGDGTDHFLVAESNYTRNTPLPAWTDESMFYRPLYSEGISNTTLNADQMEARTQAFGATLDCEQLTLGNEFQAKIKVQKYSASFTQLTFSANISIASDSGSVQCNTPVKQMSDCIDSPSAIEFVGVPEARPNATQHEINVCMGSVILGWMRESQGACSKPGSVSIRKENTLFVQCRPRLLSGTATIRVDASGRLQSPAKHVLLDGKSTDEVSARFSTDPINLIGQSNQYLFRSGSVATFHNDTFATDYMNYFIKRAGNDRLLDPSLPVPSFGDVQIPLQKAYSKLFAIWLGVNKQNLFLPTTAGSTDSVEGSRLASEQRIFLSKTMFIISEAILCTYVLVAIWVYLRRPGEYLSRMPTSIAAVIAMFAASAAVQDMQGSSHLDRKGRAKHLKLLDSRFGFGSFVGGGDGRVHIGIEKVPLVVKTRTKSTWLEQKVPLLRKQSSTIT